MSTWITSGEELSSLQIEHGVHLRILHLGTDLCTHNIDLLLRIAQLSSEDSVGESLKTFADLQIVPGANFFLLTVSPG